MPSLVFAGPNEDLLQAAGDRDGDDDPVADALRAGARINTKDQAGSTALMLAIVEGNDDIVKLLLAKRADLNARDKLGNTALMLAISKAHDDIAKLLITKRADVQARDNQGNTALIVAAGQGNGVIVSLLIAARADVNAANKLGQDALHVALLNGNAQAITALQIEAEKPKNKEARLRRQLKILDAAPPDQALMYAAAHGEMERARKALKAGAKVNAADANPDNRMMPYTPLAIAARNGHAELVTLLLAHGGDVAAKIGFSESTALALAAEAGHANVVGLLLAAKSDVNAQSHFGQTALMAAAGNGHVSVVKILLDAKAEVHTRNVGHENALTIAMRDASNPAIALLKAAGARETDPIVSKPPTTVGLTSPNKQKLYPVEKIQRHQAILKDIQDTDRRIAEIDAELNASIPGAAPRSASGSPTFTRYSCNKTGDKCTANYQGGSAESLQHTPQAASWVNDAAERDRRQLLVRKNDLVYYQKQLFREGIALEKWFSEN